MWDRKELKEKAKATLKKGYWTLVVACFILAICTGEFGISTSGLLDNKESVNIVDENHSVVEGINGRLEKLINSHVNGVLKTKKYVYKIVDSIKGLTTAKTTKERVASALLLVSAGIAFALVICVVDPLIVGGKRLFVKIRKDKNTSVKELITVYKPNQWANVIKTMLLKNLYVVLWFLTIVGGFIKAYQYILVPYILAENPNMKTKEVLELSKKMMEGNKWNMFVLTISFALWYVLAIVTRGLAGVLYVNPYVECTRAEAYEYLKENAIKNKFENIERLEVNQGGNNG